MAQSTNSNATPAQTNDSKPVQVPYLLSWDMKPGRGEAGWSVARFATLAEAHAWAAQRRESAMPCWRRKELWGGRELGTAELDRASEAA